MTWDRHLTVATGLFEIGLSTEAQGELEKINPVDKSRPEIFALRLQIHLILGEWNHAAVCAKYLRDSWPDVAGWWIALAACVRRTEDIDAAVRVLTEAREKFPDEGKGFYQLACLTAVKGDTLRARVLLATAFGYDGSLKSLASKDQDLQPVWHHIASMEHDLCKFLTLDDQGSPL